MNCIFKIGNAIIVSLFSFFFLKLTPLAFFFTDMLTGLHLRIQYFSWFPGKRLGVLQFQTYPSKYNLQPIFNLKHTLHNSDIAFLLLQKAFHEIKINYYCEINSYRVSLKT